MATIAQARPPFVEWKRIATFDPVASNTAGRRVTKDVDMAFIMQPGSRDIVERVAEDWLKSIRDRMIHTPEFAYPEDWVIGFENKYKAWKQGLDAPLDGTSVKEWAYLSPSQAENFIAIRVMTIEDVAAMTEDAMRSYGIGGRELREKAREWLKGKDSTTAENERLKAELEALKERLNALESGEPKKRGPKPKTDGRNEEASTD
jgi:hypothetical protein